VALEAMPPSGTNKTLTAKSYVLCEVIGLQRNHAHYYFLLCIDAGAPCSQLTKACMCTEAELRLGCRWATLCRTLNNTVPVLGQDNGRIFLCACMCKPCVLLVELPTS